MNFEFSDEQQMLRDQARSYLTQHCPTTLVRRVLNNRETHDADLHNGIAEMGWTATTIPEEYGGLGMSHLELVVIAEELGRACAPLRAPALLPAPRPAAPCASIPRTRRDSRARRT